MGCDIHYKFQAKNELGVWENLDIPTGWGADWVRQEFSIGRDYDLFATLANVRNSHNIPYISEPRGLPSDLVCDGDCYDFGEHSKSYLLSTEMLDFYSAKDELSTKTGVISKESYLAWDKVSPITSYSRYVGGYAVNVVAMSDVLICDCILDEATHVQVSWSECVLNDLEYFFINMVKKLHDQYGEIRFVFGFDS